MISTRNALILVAIVGLPSAASALSVTYTGSYGPALTDYTQSFDLAGFNPALGRLTGATLDFTVDGVASGTVTNTSTRPKFFSVSELVSYGFDYPQASYLNTLSTGQTYMLAAHATGMFGPNPIGDSASFAIADLAPFRAPSISVGLNTLTGVTVLGGGGNITTAITTTLGFGASVTYDYVASPAPEPATWALMVAGFGLVGGGLRRRTVLTA